MQFNSKGIWFNLFFFYRGSFEFVFIGFIFQDQSFLIFRITIKTRLVLTRLLKYDPEENQPMYAQTVHKDEEKIDDDDLVQRQKLLAKEPEVPEK